MGASRGVRIQNLGELQHERLIAIYQTCGALIYPSCFESFGLPLIEARRAGLAVLAPELDYVRDIIDPEETFEPRSPVSIARAVKRYMKECKPPFEPISASVFVDQLVQDQAP
jgi:glycosyltransferase involved in cell wall biosynthesis